MINFVTKFDNKSSNLGFFVPEEQSTLKSFKADQNIKDKVNKLLKTIDKNKDRKKIHSFDIGDNQKLFIIIIKKINSAVFPGYQGGPLMHIIAAKAVCFHEALQENFKIYIKSVVENAKILSETLKNNGFKIFSGGTDTHLMLVDLRPYKVTGKDAESSLGRANITCNKNGIPFDTEKPAITSGIRLGTPAATTRGFGLNEFKKVGDLITKIIEGLSKNSEDNSKIETEVKKEVIELCSKFPIYNHLKEN